MNDAPQTTVNETQAKALLPPDEKADGWHWLLHDGPGNPWDGVMCARWMPAAGKWWLGYYETAVSLARDGWRYYAAAPMPPGPATGDAPRMTAGQALWDLERPLSDYPRRQPWDALDAIDRNRYEVRAANVLAMSDAIRKATNGQ